MNNRPYETRAMQELRAMLSQAGLSPQAIDHFKTALMVLEENNFELVRAELNDID